MEAEQTGKKRVLGTQPKARAGWPKRLGLVRATLWADFAVISDTSWQLWQKSFLCGTFLIRLLPPTDHHELPQTQIRHTIWIWVQLLRAFAHFAHQKPLFCEGPRFASAFWLRFRILQRFTTRIGTWAKTNPSVGNPRKKPWGCCPRLSGVGNDLMKKVPPRERLPWQWAQMSTYNFGFCQLGNRGRGGIQSYSEPTSPSVPLLEINTNCVGFSGHSNA